MQAGGTELDPRTPVIVAVGQVDQRPDRAEPPVEPTRLLARAALAAQADGGTDRLLDAVDTLAVIRIFSHDYQDPARLVAAELGLDPARTIYTEEGGTWSHALLDQACREIQAGSSGTWLIGGAEAWRSRTHKQQGRLEMGWAHQGPEVQPTELLTTPSMAHPGEWARLILLPSEIYALMENAFRAEQGWTIAEHRDHLGTLWATFSDVAATNPDAWIQRRYTPEEVREATPQNRMIGFPYTKVMNANNAVDQAACFVVTSVATARDLGISRDRWVFPWVGTRAHEHWFVSHRWSLAESPAIRHAGSAALDLAGLGIDDIDHLDLYSCFPSAVQIAAKELKIGADRPLTVTGGLSFAGGPWNNYVSHSIGTMVHRLRSDEGATGLVTGNGGFLTKHAFAIFSTEPSPRPYRSADLQDEVDALPRRDLAEAGDVAVEVETSVVVFDREGRPDHALVSGLLPDGRRAWANSRDAEVMDRFVTVETHGEPGHIATDGAFTFA